VRPIELDIRGERPWASEARCGEDDGKTGTARASPRHSPRPERIAHWPQLNEIAMCY
jgi:hypothetical protein